MGTMEKKRLLLAMMAALAVPWAAGAESTTSPLGIRTKPGKEALLRARELVGELREPEMEKAREAIVRTKKNLPAGGEILKILPAAPAGQKHKEPPRLLYFFSFSMPRTSIVRAMEESGASGAVMVLRGISGTGLAETASRVFGITGRSGAAVWIDPVLFECFSVEAVPQLVLVRGLGVGCASVRYVKVAGDVSFPRALSLIEKEDPYAGIFKKRLKQNGFYDN